MKIEASHQAQLWVSDQQTLQQHAITFLQQQLCTDQGCQTCASCQQVADINHPWVQWMQPERTFSVDQIDTIIKLTSFQLDPEEKRFIILQNADNINISAANRLLKTIEEPHKGYYFILLSEQPELLPDTIRSRCVITKFNSEHTDTTHKEFLRPFMNLQFNDPVGFIRQIDTLSIKEHETKQLTNTLFEHWSQSIKKEIQRNQTPDNKAFMMLNIIKEALNEQPMPGGTKLFWKNLYITMHHAQISS